MSLGSGVSQADLEKNWQQFSADALQPVTLGVNPAQLHRRERSYDLHQ